MKMATVIVSTSYIYVGGLEFGFVRSGPVWTRSVAGYNTEGKRFVSMSTDRAAVRVRKKAANRTNVTGDRTNLERLDRHGLADHARAVRVGAGHTDGEGAIVGYVPV